MTLERGGRKRIISFRAAREQWANGGAANLENRIPRSKDRQETAERSSNFTSTSIRCQANPDQRDPKTDDRPQREMESGQPDSTF